MLGGHIEIVKHIKLLSAHGITILSQDILVQALKMHYETRCNIRGARFKSHFKY